MRRLITIKLTKDEVNAIIDAGNAGIADMHDSQEDRQLEAADVADAVLNKIAHAATAACPEGW